MSSVRILHCADLHLGSPVSFLGSNSSVLQSEQLLGLERIVNLCNQQNTDLLLIAGDLFDTPDIKDTLLFRVRELFLSLNNTLAVICAGNHDPLMYGASALERLACGEKVVILNRQNPVLEIKQKNVRVWGSSFYGPYLNTSDPFEDFNADSSYLNIALLHADLNAESGSNYNPISNAQIAVSGMDYVALGHIHKRTDILKTGNTFYAYSGCVQGTGFDELGEKGIYIGELSKGKCDLEFVKISNRIFIHENLDVSDCLANKEIIEKIKSTLLNKYENASNNLYKITLSGGIDENFIPDTAFIATALNADYFYIKVIDSTVPKIDLEALSNQNTLKGMFVKRMLELLETEQDKELLSLALQIGLKAFDGEVKAIDN